MHRGRKPLVLAGKKFGKLTALEMTNKRAYGAFVVWKCRCECGKIVEKSTQYFSRSTDRSSCGCLPKSSPEPRDLKGKKFGHLTATKIVRKDKRNNYVWLCKCDCGNSVERVGSYLAKGHVKDHCGCRTYTRKQKPRKLQKETLAKLDTMLKLLNSGTNKSDIARLYGISRERVGQILATVGR